MKYLIAVVLTVLMVVMTEAQENVTQIRIRGSADSAFTLSDVDLSDTMVIYFPQWRNAGNSTLKGYVQFVGKVEDLTGGGIVGTFNITARELVRDLDGNYRPDFYRTLSLVSTASWTEDSLYTMKIPSDSLFGPCDGFVLYGSYNGDAADVIKVTVWMVLQ